MTIKTFVRDVNVTSKVLQEVNETNDINKARSVLERYIMQERIHALGWMNAWALIGLDKGKDLRKEDIGGSLEDALLDLNKPITESEYVDIFDHDFNPDCLNHNNILFEEVLNMVNDLGCDLTIQADKLLKVKHKFHDYSFSNTGEMLRFLIDISKEDAEKSNGS